MGDHLCAHQPHATLAEIDALRRLRRIPIPSPRRLLAMLAEPGPLNEAGGGPL